MESVDPEGFQNVEKMLDNMGPLKERVSPDCSLNLQNSIKFDMLTHNRKQLLFFYSFEAVILNVTEFSIKKNCPKKSSNIEYFHKNILFQKSWDQIQ